MHRTLSSTAALAVTCMIDLALHSQTGPVALEVIAARQGISRSYADQLFGRLRRNALVRSTRGPGGGYSLGRDAAEISVADIVVAVDKPRLASARERAVHGGYKALAPDIWSELDAKLIGWFEAIALNALLGDRRPARSEQTRARCRCAAGAARRCARAELGVRTRRHARGEDAVGALTSNP